MGKICQCIELCYRQVVRKKFICLVVSPKAPIWLCEVSEQTALFLIFLREPHRHRVRSNSSHHRSIQKQSNVPEGPWGVVDRSLKSNKSQENCQVRTLGFVTDPLPFWSCPEEETPCTLLTSVVVTNSGQLTNVLTGKDQSGNSFRGVVGMVVFPTPLLPCISQPPAQAGWPADCGGKGCIPLVGLHDPHAVNLKHPAPSSVFSLSHPWSPERCPLKGLKTPASDFAWARHAFVTSGHWNSSLFFAWHCLLWPVLKLFLNSIGDY